MDIFQKLLQIEDETGGDVSNLRRLINSGQLTTASNIPQPDPKESVREIELFNRFNRDYPNYADGGRIGFRKRGFVNKGLKAAAKKVNLDSRAKSILEYQNRFGKETLDNIAQAKHGKNFTQLNTSQLNNLKRRVVKFEDFIKKNNRMPTEDEARKFGRADRDKTITGTGTKEITEQDIRNKLIKNNKYAETFKGKVIFADKSIQKQFESELTKRYLYPKTSAAAEKAGVLSNQQLYEKFLKPGYSESSARTIIDDYKKSLDLTFKELSLEEKEAKKVEREKLEKISQGGKRISGTVDNPAHHLFPLGDDIGAKAGEFTVIPKKINGQIAYANKQMKQLTEERRNLLNKVRIDQTVNIKDLDKQLADINARAEKVINNHYKKYPSHEGLLNWKKIDFVTDDVGRLLNVRQVGTIGGDYKKWTLPNIDKTLINKNIAKLNPEELKNFRNVIKDVSSQRDIKPTQLFNPINKMQLNAKIPGVETLLKAADNIKDDFKKRKFLTAGFKTLGIAVGGPLVAYDTYKAYKKGKPILEALEQGFIGTDMIGGTKRILSLTPEERTARSVVKQDALKDLNLDMPMGFGFIEGPTPDTDMTLEEALAKAAAGDERVKALEAQKNLERATNRSNFFGGLRDSIFGAPQSLSFAGGGIAGLSGGDTEGAMLKSMNPDKDGLQGLLKRVKKG